MFKRTSLKDIAQRVGVSVALVSYVLNNQKQGRISKEIAQKIRETAALLNYRPNQIARSLKTNKTYTIGLIVADISNPFSSGLARIIEDEADQQGYTVIFGSSDESAHKCEKLIGTFVNRQVDGLIMAPPEGAEAQIEQLKKNEMPFVLVDRYYPEIDSNWVSLDNYASTYQAVQHLAANSCKNIGMLNYDSPLFHLQERKRGFLEAVEHVSGNSVASLKEVSIRNDQQEIKTALSALLQSDRRVDALVFGANRLAISGLKYISTLPLKIPDDLAIVGFDETESFDFFYSPLTYIRQPLRQMGRAAVHMLLDDIKIKGKTVHIVMNPELVIRESSVRQI